MHGERVDRSALYGAAVAVPHVLQAAPESLVKIGSSGAHGSGEQI